MLSRRIVGLRALQRAITPRAALGGHRRGFSSESESDEITVMPLFASEAVRDAIQQGLGRDGYCVIKGFAGADVAQAMRGALFPL